MGSSGLEYGEVVSCRPDEEPVCGVVDMALKAC